MSVLIMGMKMPENCINCRFSYESICHATEYGEDVDYMMEHRPDWCPLTTVNLEIRRNLNRERSD